MNALRERGTYSRFRRSGAVDCWDGDGGMRSSEMQEECSGQISTSYEFP